MADMEARAKEVDIQKQELEGMNLEYTMDSGKIVRLHRGPSDWYIELLAGGRRLARVASLSSPNAPGKEFEKARRGKLTRMPGDCSRHRQKTCVPSK